MSEKVLKILFPQWQGAGHAKQLYDGAMLIHECLLPEGKFVSIDVKQQDNLVVEHDMIGYRDVLYQLALASRLISAKLPEKIFTVGGDCGVELAPVSYLNQKYEGDLAVIWLDAHGDLNSPADSRSKLFHGMPLRFLLGDGEESIKEHCYSCLDPRQILLAGTRDLDAAEEIFIRKNNISVFTCTDLIKDESNLKELINRRGFTNVYIHLDLDVLNLNDFPHVMCPAPDGLPINILLGLLQQLKKNFNVVGASVLEFVPGETEGLSNLRKIVEVLGMI